MRFRFMVALALVGAVRAAGAVDVTACGQVIGAGQMGELRQDLACTRSATWPFTALGVYLEPGAGIELNGFTIAGDASGSGVYCHGARRCTIQGPQRFGRAGCERGTQGARSDGDG
ncbi:MAG: hypothetical protein ACREQL_14355 [Candidatus Binatia bacterium]